MLLDDAMQHINNELDGAEDLHDRQLISDKSYMQLKQDWSEAKSRLELLIKNLEAENETKGTN